MKTKLLVSILLCGVSLFSLNTLNAQGQIDLSFDPGAGGDNSIVTTALQPDGKILIGGNFTAYNGTTLNRIARLNEDGSIDATYNPGSGSNATVSALALQSDGKIIAVGNFTMFNGQVRNRIVRLNSDGSLDASFNIGSGANAWIMTVVVDGDGKIVIGGQFTSFNGVSCNYIARLNSDGSLDATFNPGTGANNWVNEARLQSDGKIILAGHFTTFNGLSKSRIARLNVDGTLDNTFMAGLGANNTLYALAIQSDDKILIGGDFTSFNGLGRQRITRLNADGSLDGTFTIGGGLNGVPFTISVQPDNRIVVGGFFTGYNGVGTGRIAMINENGSLDQTFTTNSGTNTNDWINETVTQPDGKIIIVGGFTSYDGTSRNRIVRIFGDCVEPAAPTGDAFQDICDPATIEDIVVNGSSIQWYTDPTGGASLSPGTTISDGTYYASQSIINGCESTDRLEVTVTVIPLPNAPTGLDQQNFCAYNTNTVADLNATGNNVQWYTTSTGGSPLAPTTSLTQQWYYASQTINGCESSDRLPSFVFVWLPDPLTPMYLDQNLSFCPGATIEDLKPEGSTWQLNWYLDNAGGTALDPNTELIDGTTYFGVRVIAGCESVIRYPVTVNIGAIDNTLTIDGILITSNQNHATYQWIDCNNNNQSIEFETYQSYNAVNDGSYAVIIDLPNCSTQSDCITIGSSVLSEITVSSSNLSAFDQVLGTPSAEQSFTVEGTDLTANITVTAPTNYEVSLTSGSGFASSVQVNQTSGTVTATNIYVRLNAAAVGTHNGDVTLTSGALSETVAVSGTTTQNTANLNENYLNNLSIFPNPGSGMVVLSVSQPTTAVLMGVNGAVLANFDLKDKTSIDVSSYVSGIYFFRTAEGQTVKFVKQ